MKPRAFEYRRPETLAEGLGLLQQHGYEAKLLAGGQSLVPLMNFGLSRPAVVIDLNRIPGLGRMELSADGLRFGAMVRQYQVEDNRDLGQAFPLISQGVAQIGHRAIRHRGTVGGSISHADPSAEWGALAVALGAEFTVASAAGTRLVPAGQFFLGPFATCLDPAEMLTEVFIPALPAGTRSAFYEVARRDGDFALAGAAVALSLDSGGRVARARVAACGAGPVPVRLAEAEAALLGRSPTPEALADAEAAAVAESDPDGDIHASRDLRRRLTGVCVKRALAASLGNKQLARSVVSW